MKLGQLPDVSEKGTEKRIEKGSEKRSAKGSEKALPHGVVDPLLVHPRLLRHRARRPNHESS